MAKQATPAVEADKEPIPVEGLEVKGGKVIATPPAAEITPPEAQPTPEQPAKAPDDNEKVVANTGVLRVETTLEKRVNDAAETTEANLLREPKVAHADAAKLSVVVSVGTEFDLTDLNGLESAAQIVRVRLLYDWNDGQGVPHPRGQELDLPYNEAAKLVLEGRAERANPPPVPLVEQAVADAKIKALEQGAA